MGAGHFSSAKVLAFELVALADVDAFYRSYLRISWISSLAGHPAVGLPILCPSTTPFHFFDKSKCETLNPFKNE